MVTLCATLQNLRWWLHSCLKISIKKASNVQKYQKMEITHSDICNNPKQQNQNEDFKRDQVF